MTATVEVRGFAVGPLQENAWLLTNHASREAVLIDPGDEAQRLMAAVAESECTLQAIWLTHAHFDHLGAVEEILRTTSVPVWLHPLDRPLYGLAAASALRYGLRIEQPTADTVPLAEGDTLRLGTAEFRVWHLPGHAPGHVAFIGEGLCMSGDVLFEGSIGRTDLPGCDPGAMQRSLQRLATLPPDTRVLSGHGDATSIGRECLENPFLRGYARPVGA